MIHHFVDRIPDFRSPNGIYKSLSKDLGKNAIKYGLTMKQKTKIEEDAQYVFSLELFKDNPSVLYYVLGDILNKRCKPTLTHCWFKLLQDHNYLKYMFTQNVDGLERYIGIDPKRLIEVHGTFMTASCYRCGQNMNIAQVRQRVKNMDIPIKCENKDCKKGYVKPDCILFGEDLPNKYYDTMDIIKNKDKLDLLIVIGTSLSVKPVSNLPNEINSNCIRAVFNLDLSDDIEEIFSFTTNDKDDNDNKRDIFIKGKCDETILKLSEYLCWDKELKKLYQESNDQHSKILELLDTKVTTK